MAGIMLGVFLFFSNQSNFVDDPCFFGLDILKRFGYSSIYRDAFLLFVLKNRFKFYLFLVLAAFAGLFPIALYLFFCWFGMSFSVIALTLLSRYGWRGILLLLGLYLPQMLLYIPCFLYLSKLLGEIHVLRRAGQSNPCDSKKKMRSSYVRAILRLMIPLLVLLFGILIESYVNPVILKKIIKIF